ncbi:MAG: SLC13 family permease, partial [Chloroflexi bacterium]|nr:SLC13 family permease [Chloroflexota bacterium]
LTVNSVGAVAVLLPAAIGIARETKINPSKLLIPLAFGSLWGGMATLLTTPNLLVSDILLVAGYAPLSFFDFLPVGLIVALAGIFLMGGWGSALLPDRRLEEGTRGMWGLRERLTEMYHLQERLFEVRVRRDSPLVGQSIAQSQFGRALGVTILSLIRDGRARLSPSKSEVLQAGDLLVVEGKVEDFLRIEGLQNWGIDLQVNMGNEALQSREIGILEATLSPRSAAAGKTLRDLNFRDRYGLTVIALWREGRPTRTGLADLPLHLGDALLIQGPRSKIRLFKGNPNFILLDEEQEAAVPERAPWALAALGLMILLAGSGYIPVSMAALSGAMLMVLSGCLSTEEAYQAIDWRALVIIAGLWPLSLALQQSGAAAWVVDGLVGSVRGLGPLGVWGAFLIVTIGLVQMLGSAPTALLVAPLALQAALALNMNPRSLLVGVAIACSFGFLTPLSHPANLLVMGPGGYRFSDYLKVGAPLAVILFLVVLGVLPLFWPLG